MQVYRPGQGAPSRDEQASVVASCEQVVVSEKLHLGHSRKLVLQPLHLFAFYTKR